MLLLLKQKQGVHEFKGGKMAFALAAASGVAGIYGANSRRKGAHENINERRRSAHRSLLTTKANIIENNKESKQTQFQVLDKGGKIAKDIAIAGLEHEGEVRANAGAGGALVETGSNRQALSSIAQNTISAQTNVIVDTKNHIEAVARQTENENKSAWRNAKNNLATQLRIANSEAKAANNQFTADLIQTAVSSYAMGASASGTGDVTKWGAWGKKAKAAKVATTGSEIAVGMTEGPTGQYLKSGTGPTNKFANVVPKTNLTGSSRVNLQKSSYVKKSKKSLDLKRMASGKNAYGGKRRNSQWMGHRQVIERKSNKNWNWNGNLLSSSWRKYKK